MGDSGRLWGENALDEYRAEQRKKKDAFIRSLPEMMRGIRQWPDDVRAFIALPRTNNPSVRNHILSKLDELEKMADAIIAEARRLGGE